MTVGPLHATAVAIGDRAVLLIGPSGSGKSDLALRLIDRGAVLVSDDYTELVAREGHLIAKPPATIAGRLEVRGIGIVPMPHTAELPVALVVEAGTPERMPEPTKWVRDAIVVPLIHLNLLEPSAPLKVELALRDLP